MAGEQRECALGVVVELKRGYDLPQLQPWYTRKHVRLGAADYQRDSAD